MSSKTSSSSKTSIMKAAIIRANKETAIRDNASEKLLLDFYNNSLTKALANPVDLHNVQWVIDAFNSLISFYKKRKFTPRHVYMLASNTYTVICAHYVLTNNFLLARNFLIMSLRIRIKCNTMQNCLKDQLFVSDLAILSVLNVVITNKKLL